MTLLGCWCLLPKPLLRHPGANTQTSGANARQLLWHGERLVPGETLGKGRHARVPALNWGTHTAPAISCFY